MNLYDYLFYKIFKLINFFGNTDFYPEANTWFLSSSFLGLNILTLLNIIELRLGRGVTDPSYVIVFFLLYMTATYIYFFRKDRYKKILQNYDQQVGSGKTRGTIFVAIYILATLVLYYYFSERRRAMALNTK